MSEKKVTIIAKGISQKQWSVLLLEFNLIKKAWKKYGVDYVFECTGKFNSKEKLLLHLYLCNSDIFHP